MFVFRKIWCATFSCYLRFEIRPFALSLTNSPLDIDISFQSEGSQWRQVETIQLHNDGTGLGFGIVGGKSSGVIVRSIVPGGVADRDGRLKSGDNILQINEENLTGIASDQVATIIRRAGKEVKLVIAREMINDERTFESLPRQVRHLTL